MKSMFCLFVWFILSGVTVHSQKNASGIYLSQADFENNILSYVREKNTRTTKIRFHEFIEKPFITVIQNGTKEKLFKDEIFAYKNRKNIIRTWNFTKYNLVSKGVFWLYSREIYPTRGKGVKKERKYFYSLSGESEIIPMTIYNLKKSFPNNQLFHGFLEARFRSNSGISPFNSVEANIGINRFLESTIFNE
ncbi:MAG: hypothetical protein ACSLE0_05655 [Chitinophagaceae bacterium]